MSCGGSGARRATSRPARSPATRHRALWAAGSPPPARCQYAHPQCLPGGRRPQPEIGTFRRAWAFLPVFGLAGASLADLTPLYPGSGSHPASREVTRRPHRRRDPRDEVRNSPRLRGDLGDLLLREHLHDRALKSATCTPMSARPATRSTRASRRSWTSVGASTGSRSASASASGRPRTPSYPDGARRVCL